MIFDAFAQFIGQCANFVNPSYGLMGAMLVAGVLGGATHCVGMCGPFVISQTHQLERPRDLLLIPYHLGRITTYCLMAVVMYSMVNMVSFFTPERVFIIAPLLCFAGLLFIVNAFPGLYKFFPFLSRIGMPLSRYVMPIANKMLGKQYGVFGRYVLGIVLGFIPCGLVVAAVMMASTANNILMVIAAMAVFGLATMPSLIAVAIGEKRLQKRFPEIMIKIRPVLMMWGGVWLFVMAGIMVMKG